ncbi:MAG: hypothetical protein KDB11_33435, partial [Planctomycetales bacterium]|nr:hypothetical protein [Planctomycetales bacterium]
DLTFDPEETSKTIKVKVLPDFIDEYAEVFHVVISGPVNASLDTQGDELGDENRIVGIGTIVDNDPIPELRIQDVIVRETGGAANFHIVLSNPTEKPDTIIARTADMSAVEPNDYTVKNHAYSFAGGKYVTVSVPVEADSRDEGSERFNLYIDTSNSSENFNYVDSEGIATIVGINLRTDSDNNGAVSAADDLHEMDAPGRLLAVGDLAAVIVDAGETEGLDGFEVSFTVSGGVKVWTSSAKTEAFDLAKAYKIGEDAIPSGLYVEGVGAGSTTLTATISLAGDIYKSDTVLFGIYDLNLHTDSNNDGAIALDDDPVEMNAPGRVLEVSDLAPVNMFVGNLQVVPGFQITFDITGPINVWTSDAMTVQITSSTVLNTGSGSIPFTLYVQGSGPGIGILKATISSDGTDLKSDSVRLSVFDIEKLMEVNFRDNHALKSDPSPPPPANPGGAYTFTDFTASSEWFDKDLSGSATDHVDDRQYPIAYTRDTKLNADVTIKAAGPSDVDLKLKGVSSINGLVIEGTGKISGGKLDLSGLASNVNLPDSVSFVDPLNLKWKVSVNDGRTWIDVGESDNQLYLTFADPIAGGNLYQTLVHIGSTQAAGVAGAAPPRTVFDKIWSYFVPKDVRRVDGTEITYWGPGPMNTGQNSIDGLLAYANGRCGCFAQFFVGVLEAQGVGGAEVVEVLPVTNATFGWAAVFFVKEWDFVGAGTSGSAEYPYRYQVDLFDRIGIAGQNNDNPKGWFENHAIVKYENRYWDPSYGTGNFVGELDWELASIDGYGIKVSIQGVATLLGRKDDLAKVEVKFSK